MSMYDGGQYTNMPQRNNSNFNRKRNRMNRSQSVQKFAWNKSTRLDDNKYGQVSTTEILYLNEGPRDLDYNRFNYQQRYHHAPVGVGEVNKKKIDTFQKSNPIVPDKNMEQFIPKYKYYEGKSPAKEYQESKYVFSTAVKLNESKKMVLDEKVKKSVQILEKKIKQDKERYEPDLLISQNSTSGG